MEETSSSKLVEEKKQTTNWLVDLSQLSAILIAACYVSGFVIVNAHLGKYGVKDYQAFTTDYLVAGVLYAVVLGIFWFLVGKRVGELDDLHENTKRKYSVLGATGAGWKLLCIVESVASVALLTLLATTVVSFLLFSYTNQLLQNLLGISFGLIFFLNFVKSSKAETKRSRWSYFLETLAVVLIVVLFIQVMDGVFASILYFFLFLIGGITVYNDNLSSTSSRHLKVQILYTAIGVLVVVAGSFGYIFYGDIRYSIGGGKSPFVQIVVDPEETPNVLLDKLKIKNGVSSGLILLAQDDKELFLLKTSLGKDEKETIRISRDLVKAVLTQSEPR